MKTKNTYSVNIGNIGSLPFTSKRSAMETFNEYVKQSKSNYGRPAGESVTLFKNENPIKEYIGTIDNEENED